MKKIVTFVIVALVFGATMPALAQVNAEYYSQSGIVYPTGGTTIEAVAVPDDGKFIQMAPDSSIIMRFPDPYVAAPDGSSTADLRVDTYDVPYQADAEILVSLDGIAWTSVGIYADTANIDLDLEGIGIVKYVKVDQGDHYIDDNYPLFGFDLDAVVALEALDEGTIFVSTLGPAEAFNLVGTDHCVTATVDPAVAGVVVSFEVTGDNPTVGTATTDGSGEATFCYTGTVPGEDTISATVGDVTLQVTKYWFQDNFLTGGGTIKEGKKPAYNISGNVGYLPDGTIVGNFNIVDHLNKNHYKCHNAFTYLVFSGDPATSPPASYNTATFTGTFTDKDGVEEDLTIEITDNAESGGGEDTITVDGFGPIPLSGGNFQVHDGFK